MEGHKLMGEYRLIETKGGGAYQDRTTKYFLETDLPPEAARDKIAADFPGWYHEPTSLPIPHSRIRAVNGGYEVQLIRPFTD